MVNGYFGENTASLFAIDIQSGERRLLFKDSLNQFDLNQVWFDGDGVAKWVELISNEF